MKLHLPLRSLSDTLEGIITGRSGKGIPSLLLVTALLVVGSWGAIPSFQEKTELGSISLATTDFLSGTAYVDLNQNGVQDPGEPGVEDVGVEVYACDQALPVATTMTDTNGDWMFSGLAPGPYRIEFVIPGNLDLVPSLAGPGDQVGVQFATTGSTGINFALIRPGACGNQPQLISSCYVIGDQTGSDPALVRIDYANPSNVDTIALANQIGSTYGLAYQGASNSLFLAAYTKRFTGYAPGEGPGAIFRVDLSNPAANGTRFLDLNVLAGYPAAGDDPHDFVKKDAQGDILDSAAFNAVGRIGFGDIDLSDDQLTLWAVNLNDRHLYRFPLGNDPANPVAPALAMIDSFALADPMVPLPNLPANVSNREIRPFGLKVVGNELVYIGFVGNGEEGGNLVAFAYEFNVTTNTFRKVLEFDLTYGRGCAIANGSVCAGPADWNAWVETFPNPPAVPPGVLLTPQGAPIREEAHPQAMFTDIEFDANGNMIIGLRDRFGDQGGTLVPHPQSDGILYSQDGFGDLLIATPNGGNTGWSVNISDHTDPDKSLAVMGLTPVTEVAFGEDQYLRNNSANPTLNLLHEETAMGGLALLPGTNEVVTTVLDPLADAFTSGVDWFDSGNNALFRSFEIIPPNAALGKANGLGELEVLCSPIMMEVGNYVWEDRDGDGVQDACELPLAGVKVQLFTAAGHLLATTTTDADGYYYFSADGVDQASWTANGRIAPNTRYLIAFGGPMGNMTAQFQNGVLAINNQDYEITRDSTGEGPYPRRNDSDIDPDVLSAAQNDLPGGLPVIDFQTGASGVSDHTLDAGFRLRAVYDFGDLPDSYSTSNAGNMDMGAGNRIEPGKYLGYCVDGEPDAVIDPSGQAGFRGGGDDGDAGQVTEGRCASGGDDEDGIEFLTPMVPGNEACIRVTYSAFDTLNFVRDQAFFVGFIDWAGDGIFQPEDQLVFTSRNGSSLADIKDLPLDKGKNQQLELCFTVPEGAEFSGGIRARFRLGCETGMSFKGSVIGGETEDYFLPLTKIGNLNWFDNDLRGDQMTATAPISFLPETGVNGVQMVLVWAGPDDQLATPADNRIYQVTTQNGTNGEDTTGIYYFCGLTQGVYRVIPKKYATPANTFVDTFQIDDPALMVPERKILTIPNSAGDTEDSDGTPYVDIAIPDPASAGLRTGEDGVGDRPGQINGYVDTLDDLSLDFGWIQEPNIEVVQRIVGFEHPSDEQTCGQFQVIIDACIQNTAGSEMDYAMGVPLQNIDAGTDLTRQLGAAFVQVVGTPELVGVQIAQLEYGPTPPAPAAFPVINPGFDGAQDTSLFDGNSGLLYPGQKIMVRYRVELNPEMPGAPQDIRFQMKVRADAVNYQGQPIIDFFSGNPFMAMDLSDDGPISGGYDGEDDPTPLPDCWKTAFPVAANDLINVTADENCMVHVCIGQLITNYDPACDTLFPLGGFYRFFIEGTPEKQKSCVELDVSMFVDQKIKFLAKTVNGVCQPVWGEVHIEDKTGPLVDSMDFRADTLDLYCPDLDHILNNPLTLHPGYRYYSGRVFFRDNCSLRTYTPAFRDHVVYGTCDSAFYAKIYRTFFAAEDPEHSQEKVQVLVFRRPHPGMFSRLEDQIIQTCAAELSDVPVRYLYYVGAFGDTVYLNEVECNLAVTTEEEVFEVCDGKGKKIQRYYRVFDWCTGASEYLDTVLIKIGDFAPPVIRTNADTVTISTGPMDCTAAFSTEQAILEKVFHLQISDCQVAGINSRIESWGDTLIYGIPVGPKKWRRGNYPQNGKVYTAVPVGLHRLIVSAFDGCYNAATDTVYFLVKDLVAPVMKCDDELHVSLSTGGYAKVFATDVDEGSWDNCSLGELWVRRAVPATCFPAFMAAGYDRNADGILDDRDGWEKVNQVWYTPWQAYVEFFCCDLGTAPVVELRGADRASHPVTRMPMPNYSYCWLEVRIEEKAGPQCVAPPPVTVLCDDPGLADLTAFGTAAVIFEYCDNITIEELPPLDRTDHCGAGQLIRRFQAVKDIGTPFEQRGDTCSQTITILLRHRYAICFPEDVRADCQDAAVIPGVTYQEVACDLLAISHDDEFFAATTDSACYKIFRTYRVINWCEYDGLTPPVVVGRDWDAWNGTNPTAPQGDGRPGDEGICVVVARDFQDGRPDTVWYDRDTDPYNDQPDNPESRPDGYWWRIISGGNDPAEDTYFTGSGSTWGTPRKPGAPQEAAGRYGSFGFWQYTQHIIVYDRVAPEAVLEMPDTVCATAADCDGAFSLKVMVTDNCTDAADFEVKAFLDAQNDGTLNGALQATRSGEEWTVTGNGPLGAHRIVVQIADGCGNRTSRSIVFTIADCKAPAPICINGLAAELMPLEPGVDADGDGDADAAAAAVWATDFLASKIYDCTGRGAVNAQGLPEVTEFYITRTDVNVLTDSNKATSLILTCDDLTERILMVRIWAVDGAGNADFCETFVEVQDNMLSCEGATEMSVQGAVFTEEQASVEHVQVQLTGGKVASMVTNWDGSFRFDRLSEGYNYSIAALRDDDHRNGVSTLDLILMQRHILGIDLLPTPYKLIAADVNNSGSVTTMDMIALRRLILGIDRQLPGNTSWRFVDRAYEFPDPRNPWAEPFPELIHLHNANAANYSMQFVGIKIGDLNCSAIANETMAAPRQRSGKRMVLLPEMTLEAGVTYQIPLMQEDWRLLEGWQFALKVHPEKAVLHSVQPGLAGDEHLLAVPEAGSIRVSWNRNAADPDAELQPRELFTILLTARQNGPLSGVIQMESGMIMPEAYWGVQRSAEVGLEFSPRISGGPAGMELFQNQPNPFRDHTEITFRMPENGKGHLTIFNAEGKLILERTGIFSAGVHRIRLQRGTDLPEGGIYFYTLQTGFGTATRRMLVLD